MGNDLLDKVDALDDKQAVYVTQRLAEALFKKVQPPSLDLIAGAIDKVTDASGAGSGIAQHEGLGKMTLQAGNAGEAARAVLRAWGQDPNLATAVKQAIEQFKTAKQDLGILSVPVALGLTYALFAIDLDVDLGFVKIKKKGLTGAQQTEIVKKTIEPVLKAIRAVTG
jgi:hypothetical protein